MSLPLDKIRELRAQRATLVTEARQLLDQHPTALPAEVEARYQKVDADIDALTARINREERLLDQEGEKQEQRAQTEARVGGHAADLLESDKYKAAFRSYLLLGKDGLNQEQRSILSQGMSYEARAQGISPNSSGGFTVPRFMADEITTLLKAFGGPREVATVIRTVSGAPIDYPTVNDTSNTGALLPEHDPATDLDIAFGAKTLGAYTYTSRLIKVGRALMQDSAFDMEAYIRDRFVERIGRATTLHYTTGNGSTQPEGLVTAAAAGFQPANGSSNNTTIKYSHLVDTEHALDPAYRQRGAAWMFNDSTLKAVKQLVDGQQRPLWAPGLAVREPDTVLGYRYVINQNMANIGASNKPILFGDFSQFIIRDVLDMALFRLEEAYAVNFQVGFVGFMRTDSKLIDTTSVVFFQNSAS
jgi:HK97 family phage major capsid protein